jgi:hypothetical protein
VGGLAAALRDEWDDAAALTDPGRGAARHHAHEGPEPKAAKNRLHLDLQVSGGRHQPAAARAEQIEATVARLIDVGATRLARYAQPDGSLDHVVMADPEGNEFCVV